MYLNFKCVLFCINVAKTTVLNCFLYAKNGLIVRLNLCYTGRAFLEEWYAYMGALKEAKEEDEAGEARALKLLKQVERELFKRQEKPDDSACALSVS